MLNLKTNSPRIALVGFGEAASTIFSGWELADPTTVRAFDVKTLSAAHADAMRSRYRAAQISGCETLADALDGATVIFSLVTADQALVAAESAAGALSTGALWLDCNSCSPETKRRAATAIETGGGRYVDVAVMAPVYPARHRTPLLVSGPHAEAAIARLKTLDMRPTFGGDAVGEASAVKMIRSIMIKGMEALSAECVLAARRAGVDATVLASLQASNPEIDWPVRSAYHLERMMAHGARRAAEMREVAATVRELGLPSRMSEAAAFWQDEIAALGLDAGDDALAPRADCILARLAQR